MRSYYDVTVSFDYYPTPNARKKRTAIKRYKYTRAESPEQALSQARARLLNALRYEVR